jgi:membrane protein
MSVSPNEKATSMGTSGFQDTQHHGGAPRFGNVLRRCWEVVTQSVKDLFADNGPQWAAAIAYYGLLSVFPLLIAVVAIAAYLVEPQWAIDQITQVVRPLIPQVGLRIRPIVQGAIAASGTIGALSLVLLLWTGSRVFATLTLALNVAYDSGQKYGFWKRTLIEFLMMATIGVLFIFALSARPLLTLLSSVLGVLQIPEAIAVRAVQWLVPPFALFVALCLLYRFVPRATQSWRPASIGAAAATLLFLAARPLFFYYVRWFAHYNLIYGSVAIVVIVLLWIWLMALIVLLGGELASHSQALFFGGRPVEALLTRTRRDRRAGESFERHTTISRTS